jgi:hypothetical protein
LPLAFQYGQPLDEFWHGDMRLLKARQIAYYRDKTYTAWINGSRTFEANSKVSANANRTKKTDKVEQYSSEWKDPFEKKKKRITHENLESEFRKEQFNQNSWLHNILCK